MWVYSMVNEEEITDFRALLPKTLSLSFHRKKFNSWYQWGEYTEEGWRERNKKKIRDNIRNCCCCVAIIKQKILFFVSMFMLENSIFTNNLNDPREKSTREKKRLVNFKTKSFSSKKNPWMCNVRWRGRGYVVRGRKEDFVITYACLSSWIYSNFYKYSIDHSLKIEAEVNADKFQSKFFKLVNRFSIMFLHLQHGDQSWVCTFNTKTNIDLSHACSICMQVLIHTFSHLLFILLIFLLHNRINLNKNRFIDFLITLHIFRSRCGSGERQRRERENTFLDVCRVFAREAEE